MSAEERDEGAIKRAEAQLAETAAVIPTIELKIETYLGELEGVMATIEDAKADEMEAIKETDEWKAAETAAENARNFQNQ